LTARPVSTDVTVVIATRNRRDRLLRTLDQLTALPEAPPIIVVDNDSHDGSVAAVRHHQPAVRVVALPENRGAAARTVGVESARSPYVAFSDDDSWWQPGALTRAVHHLDAHPDLGLLAAKILVGTHERLDPTSAEMAHSPLSCPRDLPGPPVLGFVACGAVVRRRAYLQVGGFSPLLFFVSEERLLALDLAVAGWDLAYAPDVIAVHHPDRGRPGDEARSALVLRNDLLTDWMRRPLSVALRSSCSLAGRTLHDRHARSGLAGALRRAPAALRRRHRLPRAVERQLRELAAPVEPATRA
jgi:GT2 family glycosyltransferase